METSQTAIQEPVGQRNFTHETLDTPFGQTRIKSIGSGPPIIVLHGGPGFSHEYLVDGLLSLKQDRKVIFYDQPLIKERAKGDFSPLCLYGHFRWLANFLSSGQPLGVIAHSWGSLVFTASMTDPTFSSEPKPNFSEVLLLNPMPITTQDFKACRQILLNRFSTFSKLKLLYLFFFEQDAQKIMDVLLPHYVNDQSLIPDRGFFLDKASHLELTKQLKDFDYGSYLDALPPFHALLADSDFIEKQHVKPLLEKAQEYHLIPDAGHFPFWEQPERFEQVLKQVFKT